MYSPQELYSLSHTSDELRARWNAQNLQLISTARDIERLEEEVQDRWQHRSVLTRLLIATASFLASYTHVLCYIVACIVLANSGGLIKLPLPLMVFFWATLSSPRPTKCKSVVVVGDQLLADLSSFSILGHNDFVHRADHPSPIPLPIQIVNLGRRGSGRRNVRISAGLRVGHPEGEEAGCGLGRRPAGLFVSASVHAAADWTVE